MDLDVGQRIARKAFGEQVRHVVDRREAVAKFLTSNTKSVDDAVRLFSEFSVYLTTHLGRNAYGTTRLKKCRTKDHKHRSRKRVDAAIHTFDHNVDLHRAWCGFRAHFVPGGKVWVNMGRSQKRRIHAAIHQADLHVRTYGDYVGAFAMVKGG
jgi:hypothetical protein